MTNPFPFGTVETASDVYAAAGYIEEAGELLDARIPLTASNNERSRLQAKRLGLPFHYIQHLLEQPESFTPTETSEIQSDIEASYGQLGELLQTELSILDEAEAQLFASDNPQERARNHGIIREKIGRIAEITFQALAAREYSYNPDAPFYAVPASEEIDRYGRTRASDLVFYLADENNTYTHVVMAQVKMADTTINQKNREREAKGLQPLHYDDDIAMLFLKEATNTLGEDTFRLDDMTLPRAIIAELEGTSTDHQEELIQAATTYMHNKVFEVAEHKHDASETQKTPEQIGA